jgi:hypothetical protein
MKTSVKKRNVFAYYPASVFVATLRLKDRIGKYSRYGKWQTCDGTEFLSDPFYSFF